MPKCTTRKQCIPELVEIDDTPYYVLRRNHRSTGRESSASVKARSRTLKRSNQIAAKGAGDKGKPCYLKSVHKTKSGCVSIWLRSKRNSRCIREDEAKLTYRTQNFMNCRCAIDVQERIAKRANTHARLKTRE